MVQRQSQAKVMKGLDNSSL